MATHKSPTKSTSGPIRPFRIAGAGEIRISARIQDSEPIPEESEDAEELVDAPLTEVSVATSQNVTIKNPSPRKNTLNGSPKKSDIKNLKVKSKVTGAAAAAAAAAVRPQARISMIATTNKGESSSRGKAPARSVSPKKQILPQTKQAISPRKAGSIVSKATINTAGSNRLSPTKTKTVTTTTGTGTPTRSNAPPPPPSTPNTPTATSPSKARRFHDCSHYHGSKSGYTPKMRDPRQPLHELKTTEAPSGESDKKGWKIFTNETESRTVFVEAKKIASVKVDNEGNKEDDPFGPTNPTLTDRPTVDALDSPGTPLEDEDKENKSPSKLPLPIQQELLVAGLKKQLHAIARGDIFAVDVGDMPHLPDLVDMPKVSQYILRDFDFTDPTIFTVLEGQNEEVSLLCKVVKQYLETTQEEEMMMIRNAGKLDVFHKMNEAPNEFVKYFTDEITLQGSYLNELRCKLKNVEEQWMGLRREYYLANQQQLKLQRLHAAAAGLAKCSKANTHSPTMFYTPTKFRSRSSSPEKKSSPLKNVVCGDEEA